MNKNRESLVDNLDIVGIILVAIATIFIKDYNIGLYMIVENLGSSLVFAKIYVQFKLADRNYDKGFYGLAMAGIMIACLSIFNW